MLSAFAFLKTLTQILWAVKADVSVICTPDEFVLSQIPNNHSIVLICAAELTELYILPAY